MSTPRTGAVADRLTALLEPVVAGTGLDLEAVRVTPAGKRRRVEVIVDGDGGVSIDAVADVARLVSEALDGPEGVGIMGEQQYVLEVSSPGTDRPLTAPRHWRRAKSRLVKAHLVAGGEVTGRVLDSDDEGVLLAVPAKKDTVEERRLAYSEIAKARVEIEFSRKGEDELDEDEEVLDDEDFADEDLDGDDGDDEDAGDDEEAEEG